MAEIEGFEGEWPYVRFSLEERDRRWSAIRQRMERDKIDVIVTPPNTGFATDHQADSRYISGVGGGLNAGVGVIFPREGEVTVVANAASRWGPAVQTWVSDIREAARQFGHTMGDRLKELELGTKPRIGLSGLGPGTRSPEGTILRGTYDAISESVPGAEFVDVVDLLQEVREIKSAEELQVLSWSLQLVEAGIEAQTHYAQPGVPDYVVWAEGVHAMLARGSELAIHFNRKAAPNPHDTLTRATMRPLEKGDIIRYEMEASVIGYRAQQERPIAVHECKTPFADLATLHKEEFYPAVLEGLKAGATVGDLVAHTVKIVKSMAAKRGPLKDVEAALTLHGRGLGDDRPLVLTTLGGASLYEGTDRHWDLPFPENGVYICKPSLRTADGQYVYRWGDTVRTTPRGGIRMGSAEAGLVVSEPADVEWPDTPLKAGVIDA